MAEQKDSLIVKYRPKVFEDVVGQAAVVKSFSEALEERSSQQFIFTGSVPGIGKTSLARIGAKLVGATGHNLMEVAAAVSNSVEDMRNLIVPLSYRPLGSGKAKAIILDECFAPLSEVDVPGGRKVIANVKVGDTIIGAMGPAKVKTVFKNKVPLSRIVVLRLETGQIILCSCDHKFLTREGWCEANRLKGKSCQRTVPAQLLRLYDGILLKSFWYALLRSMLAAHLLSVREVFFGTPIFEKSDLFKRLRQSFRRVKTYGASLVSVASESISCAKAFPSSELGALSGFESRELCADESRQSFVEEGGYREDTRYQKETRHSSYLARRAWREWEDNTTTKDASCFTKMQDRISYIDWTQLVRQIRFSDLLQGGFSVSKMFACYRGGRTWSQIKAEGSARSKKRWEVKTIRVDSVESYQQRSRSECEQSGIPYIDVKDGFAEFIDLEIEGHPSYKVDGLIVHNCHRLSGNAWDSILKETEEPPAWVYWFFCTTNIVRIPRTIQSRCAIYTLQPVNKDIILEHLLDVADWEELKTPKEILTLCAYEAGGSVRNALSFLSVCRNCRNRKEAAQLIVQAEEDIGGPGFMLAQALAKGSWAQVQPVLKELTGLDNQDEDAPKTDKQPPAYTAENIRHTIRAYFTKVAVNAKDAKMAAGAVRILEIFSEPCNPVDGFSPIVLGCGRAVLAQN